MDNNMNGQSPYSQPVNMGMQNDQQQYYQPQYSQQYGQDMNTNRADGQQYYAQSQFEMPYNQQPQMGQQASGMQPQMGQPVGGIQPQMGQQAGGMQPQMGQPAGMQNQPMYDQFGQPVVKKGPSAFDKFKGKVGTVKTEFSGRTKQISISIWCLMGLIAAMLFIAAPFMNLTSVRYKSEVDDVKVKLSDGFNMFELSDISNTIDNYIDKREEESDEKIKKRHLTDKLERYEKQVSSSLSNYLYGSVGADIDIDDESVKKVFGTAHLAIRGQLPLAISPILIIISGILLFIATVIVDKIMKLIFSLIPLGCLVWIIACSRHFTAIMGIGAWVLILAIILGLASTLMDKNVHN